MCNKQTIFVFNLMIICSQSHFFFRHCLRWLLKQGGRQIDPTAHTIKSHGATLARNHIHDWLILVLLILIEVILNVIHPFRRFVGRDMMEDLRYPMKQNTVPVWAVPVSSFTLGCLHIKGPFCLFFRLFYLHRIQFFNCIVLNIKCR